MGFLIGTGHGADCHSTAAQVAWFDTRRIGLFANRDQFVAIRGTVIKLPNGPDASLVKTSASPSNKESCEGVAMLPNSVLTSGSYWIMWSSIRKSGANGNDFFSGSNAGFPG